MALKRRSGTQFSANIWPGFVDAMTALLLVLMFVLTIFMIVQFVLRETITSQDVELDHLSSEIQGLASALGLARDKSAALQNDVSELNSSLAAREKQANEQKSLIDILAAQNEGQAKKLDDFKLQVTDFETQVAGLLSQNTKLNTDLRGNRTKVTVLTGEANALRARNRRLATDLAGQAAAFATLTAQNRQLTADSNAQVQANLALLAQNRTLTADAAAQADRLAGLQSRNKTLSANAAAAVAANDALSAENRQLAADVAGNNSASAALKAQNEKLAADVTGRAKDNAQLAEKNRQLNAELARRAQEIDTLNAQNRQLAETSDSQAVENAELAEQNETLLADKDALARANLQVISESEALQLALVQARDEMDVEVEQARLAAVKREAMELLLRDLQQVVKSKDGSLNDALAALASTSGNVSDLQAELAQTGEQLAASRALVQELQKAQSETLQALTLANDTLAKTDAELVARSSELSATKGDLAAVDENLLLAQGELNATLGELARAKEDLNVTQGKLQESRADVAARGLTEEQLRKRISVMAAGLSDAEKSRLAEAAAAAALRARLQGAQDELTAMTLSLEAQRQAAEDTLTLLAAAELAQDKAQEQATAELTDRQKNAGLLAAANSLLAEEKALSAEGKRKVTLLNQQTVELRKQLDQLQGLLDQSNARDVISKVQIEALGSNLNAALAQVASEQKKLAKEQTALALEQTARADLEEKERIRLQAETKDLKKFRSEFFGRLRDVLGAQEGIRIVGDRFVFSSEILFGAGSADLGDRGKREIGKVAGIILDVADQIPAGIDWILRVDGHTDKKPLSGRGQYRDNWELSQARALSVVKYLIDDLGVPANRLAANGFGEFQPVVDGEGPEALALNRRIELKFTEK